jgi:phosphatidylserine/phosphatidylglycerophosphate/cardiolipin synthase-like enzyme
MKATAHGGAMHMKAIITPDVATWGSGNLSRSSSKQVRGCQSKYYQDEDLVRTTDAGLVAGMQARFDAMWNSPDFADFDPTTAGSPGVVDDVE